MKNKKVWLGIIIGIVILSLGVGAALTPTATPGVALTAATPSTSHSQTTAVDIASHNNDFTRAYKACCAQAQSLALRSEPPVGVLHTLCCTGAGAIDKKPKDKSKPMTGCVFDQLFNSGGVTSLQCTRTVTGTAAQICRGSSC